jgi:hypothetical protein
MTSEHSFQPTGLTWRLGAGYDRRAWGRGGAYVRWGIAVSQNIQKMVLFSGTPHGHGEPSLFAPAPYPSGLAGVRGLPTGRG